MTTTCLAALIQNNPREPVPEKKHSPYHSHYYYDFTNDNNGILLLLVYIFIILVHNFNLLSNFFHRLNAGTIQVVIELSGLDE